MFRYRIRSYDDADHPHCRDRYDAWHGRGERPEKDCYLLRYDRKSIAFLVPGFFRRFRNLGNMAGIGGYAGALDAGKYHLMQKTQKTVANHK